MHDSDILGLKSPLFDAFQRGAKTVTFQYMVPADIEAHSTIVVADRVTKRFAWALCESHATQKVASVDRETLQRGGHGDLGQLVRTLQTCYPGRGVTASDYIHVVKFVYIRRVQAMELACWRGPHMLAAKKKVFARKPGPSILTALADEW